MTTIRPAQPEEAATITNLVLRSKAHWGYDAAFMEAHRGPLSVTTAYLTDHPAYVLTYQERIRGFYSLVAHSDILVELDFLFIDPGAIRLGYGRQLFAHAVETALRLGYQTLELTSDPNAEGFYLAMGARRVGDQASTIIPGRSLPLFRYNLSKENKEEPHATGL